ncbi:MAG: DUF1364 domain-containing protein [Hyphomicrobiales bacterium]|nr:DUF1364 domain-containing protein [Hyphomicrobiales bacterium]
MPFISQKLRDSAKGEQCNFRIPGICSCDTSKTVLCHLPSEFNGGGMKSPDYWAAFGCYECHDYFDNNKLDPFEKLRVGQRALIRTWKRWIELGLIFVPETTKRKKTVSKIVKRPSLYRSE